MSGDSLNSFFHEVGRVKDAHGLKGELFVRLYAGRADWLEKFDVGYLLSPDQSEIFQFTVESASPHKDGLILSLGLDDRTPAEALKGFTLQIAHDLLISKPGEDFYLNEIVGFELIDLATNKKSIVKGISSNGPQDLLEVEYESETYLVPFVRPLIEKVDFDKRQIRMNLPPGLIDQNVLVGKKRH